MFVEVTEGRVAVRDAADLKGLAVHAVDRTQLSALGDLQQLGGAGSDDGDHVWLSIAALKAAAMATLPDDDRAAWSEAYDGMIAYATSKGWTSPDGAAVRAHLEP
jgi:hypothetical protein